jgi:hypothetical protein
VSCSGSQTVTARSVDSGQHVHRVQLDHLVGDGRLVARDGARVQHAAQVHEAVGLEVAAGAAGQRVEPVELGVGGGHGRLLEDLR